MNTAWHDHLLASRPRSPFGCLPMRYLNQLIAVCVWLRPAAAAAAADKPEVAIRRVLAAGGTDLRVESVTLSQSPGLCAVQCENGPMLYATADAKYSVLGDLCQVRADGFIN